MRNSRIQDLKDVQIKKIVREGIKRRTAVGGVPGLSIDVSGPGVARWVLRLQGKRNTTLGLGSFSAVSLSQAREKARRVLQTIDEGKDPKSILNPSQETPTEQTATVNVLFPEWLKICEKAQKWKYEDDYKKAKQRFRDYIAPVIGEKFVSEVTPRDIGEKIITPVVVTSGKVGTADKLLPLLNQFFEWCNNEGLLDSEKRLPTDKKRLSSYLPPKRVMKEKRTNYPMCSVDMLPDLVAILVKPEQFLNVGTMAFLFSILTNSRHSNIATTRTVKKNYANWNDIDISHALWTIPAAKMKKPENGPHFVPLSDAAMLILNRLIKLGYKQNDVVFPNDQTFKPLGENVFRTLIRKINDERKASGLPEFLDPETKKTITQHGTARATFKSWCEDRGFPYELSEKALHHEADKRLGRSYDRSPAIEPRRKIAQEWANYCLSKSPKDWYEIKFK